MGRLLVACATVASALARPLVVELPPAQWTANSLRRHIEQRVQSGNPSTVVHLRFQTGTHYLAEPIDVAKLGDLASIDEIAGDSQAVIDGGVVLPPFSAGSGNVWTTNIPSTLFISQLTINGFRRILARSPNAVDNSAEGLYTDNAVFHMLGPLQNCSAPCWGTCPATNALGFLYNTSEPLSPQPSWDMTQARVLTFGSWTGVWTAAGQVYPQNNTLLYGQPSVYKVGAFGTARDTPSGGRWMIENTPEALDAPGEWYADPPSAAGQAQASTATAAARTLYYIPMPGETPETVSAVVAATPTLLNLRGSSIDAPVTGLYVHDLTLRNFAEASPSSRWGQGYSPSAANEIAYAVNVTIQRVNITSGMGSGVLVEAGVSGLVLDRLGITDVGGNGISAMLLDGAPNNITDTMISNCTIDNVGFIYMGQPGGIVVAGKSVSVVHNEVSNVPYGAIQAGWQHGTTQPDQRPADPTFTIAYNYIHDYGLGVLNDFGGIYTSAWAGDDCWKLDPPTCYTPVDVHHNFVARGRHYLGGYGSNGGYMDEGIGGVMWHHNIFSDVGNVDLFFHCGVNNSAWNNVFAYAQQQSLNPAENKGGSLGACDTGGFTPPDGQAIAVDTNIIVANGTGFPFEMTDMWWRPGSGPSNTSDTTAADNNVYWATDTIQPSALLWPNSTNLTAWQGMTGNDVHSLVADPLFFDAPNGNFALQPGSPAWALGWTELEVSTVGPLPELD